MFQQNTARDSFANRCNNIFNKTVSPKKDYFDYERTVHFAKKKGTKTIKNLTKINFLQMLKLLLLKRLFNLEKILFTLNDSLYSRIH